MSGDSSQLCRFPSLLIDGDGDYYPVCLATIVVYGGGGSELFLHDAVSDRTIGSGWIYTITPTIT